MVFEVIARYVFVRPTIWTYETNQFFFATAIALGGGWAYLAGKHVSVDIVGKRLGIRGRAITFMVVRKIEAFPIRTIAGGLATIVGVLLIL